jgi:hypothetical protein
VRDLLGKDQTSTLEVKERPDIGVYVKVNPTIYTLIRTLETRKRDGGGEGGRLGTVTESCSRIHRSP